MTDKPEKNYKIVDGTYYDVRTPDEIVSILEDSRKNRKRIRIHYGFTNAAEAQEKGKQVGRDWLEENDVTGHVGRSTGSIKIPLMIATDRSTGGPGLLEYCIVKIRDTCGQVLYQHPNYHYGRIALDQDWTRQHGGKKYPFMVLVDGEVHASFETEQKRTKYLQKMGLEIGKQFAATSPALS